MRDRPDGYLFDSMENCCKAHFSWDDSCGYNDPLRVWYYPQYDEATCYEKPLGEFDSYHTEKYVTKNYCCMQKFDADIMTCCHKGEGECTSTGSPVYIPNWAMQTCQARDSSLVPEWEKSWVSNTIEECCNECKYHDFEMFYCSYEKYLRHVFFQNITRI